MFRLENRLKGIMLKSVDFYLDGKIIKQGKIKVFNTKQFFIKFKIENGDIVKEYELPYPFRVDTLTNGFMFDYCLSAFIPNTEEVFWKMKTINNADHSKLHEKYLYILEK